MNPVSIVEEAEQKEEQMDGWTDRQGQTTRPPFNFFEGGEGWGVEGGGWGWVGIMYNNRIGRSGTTAAQNLRLSSFAVHAPGLFNSLPDYIRNTTDCSLNVFKGLLDKFLASVPDEPLIRGYTAYLRADTNSLFDMARFATAQSLPGLEEPDNISDAGGGHPWSP